MEDDALFWPKELPNGPARVVQRGGRAQAAQQDVLAELAGTDAYWITVSVPVDRITWITIPGSKAQIYSGDRAVREGRVIKLLGDLETKGRMARLLIEVKDPLALLPENMGKKPLLIGEYVRVDVDGRVLSNVFSLPRNALRENSRIWLADSNNQLELRTVDVLWRDADRVIVKDNLSAGDKLITSDITAPITGMPLSSGKGKKSTSTSPKAAEGKPAN